MNSRDLKELEPGTRAKAEKFVKLCKEAGLDILITSTFRSAEAQAKIYAQGRTAPGRVVTKARPGFSWHNFRRAIDFVPMRDGKCVWGTRGADGELWHRAGKIGEECGFEWGGRWTKFLDMPHLQNRDGQSLAQMRLKYGTEAPKED